MLYTTFKVKDKEYKARLSTKECVDLEKRLKTNPLNLFLKAANGEIPSLESLLIMLQASLEKYQHGISMDAVYEIFDDYCEDGGDIMSLIQLLMNVLTDAGFVPKKVEEDSSKN